MILPTGYTEVQYIQSSGTQYIDTEFKPNQDSHVMAKLSTSETGNHTVFGADLSWTDNGFALGTGFAHYGKETGTISGLNNGSPHEVDFNKNTISIDGSAVLTMGTSTFSISHNMALFANNRAGGIEEKTTMVLYYCQIYNGNIIVRNYIPCINPDGEAGLYDTVNSKFYGNAGTGVFFAGPPRVSLPSIYTQLEYILSSGTQVIDTGVTPGNITKVEIDFEPTTVNAHHLMILGTRNTSSGGNQFIIGWIGHKSPAVWRSDYGSSQVRFTTAITGAARHYAVKNGASCKIDTETVSNTAVTFMSSYTLYLFGGNQANTAVSQITAKLYRCKIYTSDQLVRDFIPCSNPSGAVGLYDLVNSKFYANAGTGVFTAGPEVTWPSNDAIYVKVNGIWRQIDGIKLL